MRKYCAEYYYDPELAVVAKALAAKDSYRLTDESYSVTESPNPRAMHYWRRAFAAVEAVNQFRGCTEQEISGETR